MERTGFEEEQPSRPGCSLIMAIAGVLYLIGPSPIVAAIRNLGYPDYLRQLLGIAKLLGAAALIAPGLRRTTSNASANTAGAACAIGSPLIVCEAMAPTTSKVKLA